MVNHSIKAISSLRHQAVRTVLDRLHDAARGDRWHLLQLLPRVVAGRLAGRELSEILTPTALKDLFIPISREQGEFLYLTARAVGARRVVEFGTLRPYVEYMQSGQNGFESMTLKMGGGFEYSYYVG